MGSFADLGNALDGLRYQIVNLTDGCKGLRRDLEAVKKELDGVPDQVVDGLLATAFGMHEGRKAQKHIEAAIRKELNKPKSPYGSRDGVGRPDGFEEFARVVINRNGRP